MAEPVGAPPAPVASESSVSAMGRRRDGTPAAVWVLMAAFALLCATWSVMTPTLRAPDERAHFSSVVRLVDGFSWPAPGEARIPASIVDIGGEHDLPRDERSSLAERAAAIPGESDILDQMTQHPPLYYLIAGKLIALTGAMNWNWDEALLLVRLLGAPVGAAFVWLAWSTVHTLVRSRRAGIVAAATAFLVPGFAQMLGLTNNDTLAILLGTVITWLSVKLLTGHRTLPVLIGMGIAFGLAGLAKGTLIAFAPLVILALLFGREHPPTWPRRIWQTAWPLLIALAVGQWWWLRNLVLYGTLQPYGYLLSDTTWQPGDGPDIRFFADELWRITPATFWGWFGRVNAPLPQGLVDVLTVVCVGLVIVGLFRTRKQVLTIVALASPILVSLILLVRVSWGAYAETSEFRGMHGRYFYPVLLLGIALAALAMMTLLRDARGRTRFGIAAVVVSAFMSVYGLGVAYIYHYADDDWNQWRSGVRPLLDISALPSWLTLFVPALFGVVFLVAFVLAVRDVARAPVARDAAPLAPAETAL